MANKSFQLCLHKNIVATHTNLIRNIFCLVIVINFLHLFQTIRIQTPNGMKRVEIPKNSSFKDLYEIAYKTLQLVDYGFSLFTDRSCKDEVHSTFPNTIETKLKHGDLLYFKQVAGSSSVSYLHHPFHS